MRIVRYILWAFLAVLLTGIAGGAVYLWYFKVDEWVRPVLVPINQKYAGDTIVPDKVRGFRLTPLEVKGWDSGDLPVLIVERGPEGEETSRQLSALATLSRKPEKLEKLRHIDYVLVCVDWDHGIRSALPLAEVLTAAGLRCVLWEPRGKDNRRAYCTQGLKECEDVPQIIDALTRLSGKEKPVIVGVGQGYGAGLMLQAAAREPRLRGVVSVDAYASLRDAVGLTLPQSSLKPAYIWLMDLKMKSSAGYECFDVAPVESASHIDRNVPVLVINLEQEKEICTVKDAVCIYRRLRVDKRAVWTLRNESDGPSPETEDLAEPPTRTVTIKEVKDSKERIEQQDVVLMDDADSAWVHVVYWLSDELVGSLASPRSLVPERPALLPTQQL